MKTWEQVRDLYAKRRVVAELDALREWTDWRIPPATVEDVDVVKIEFEEAEAHVYGGSQDYTDPARWIVTFNLLTGAVWDGYGRKIRTVSIEPDDFGKLVKELLELAVDEEES